MGSLCQDTVTTTVPQSHSSTLPVCLVMVDVEESDNSEQAQLVTVHGRLGSVTFKPYRDIKTRTVTTVGDQADTASCLTVDSLYPEILCHVFSYLDTSSKGRAAQVCTRWRNVLNTKEIWRGCEARLHLRRLTSSVMAGLVRRGIKRVQVLSIKKSLKELATGIQTLTGPTSLAAQECRTS